MKASELIEKLKEKIEIYGDKEVRFKHCYEGGEMFGTEEIEFVTYDDADDVDDVIVLW